METHTHPPESGKPKNGTQMISLMFGFILSVIGLCGLLFPAFAGLHLSVFHSIVIFASGATLLYNGWRDDDLNAFIACALFGLFFGIHAVAGFVLGEPGQPQVGNMAPDASLLKIIPNFQELGTADHVMNGVIALVLLGGALDWWRVHRERKPNEEIKQKIQHSIARHHH